MRDCAAERDDSVVARVACKVCVAEAMDFWLESSFFKEAMRSLATGLS